MGIADDLLPSPVASPFTRNDIHRICRSLDILLDRPLNPNGYSVENMKYDKWRQHYLPFIDELYRSTRVGAELATLLERMVEDKKKHARPFKKIKKKEIGNMSALYSLILYYDRFCPFEPEWHMKRRGAKTKMWSDAVYKNCWRYLVGLYCFPERTAEDVPDWVIKNYHNIKGLKNCVNDARAEARKMLVEKYGVDWKEKAKPREEHAVIIDDEAFLSGEMLAAIRGEEYIGG